jgi:hypothetical protein
MRHFPLRELGYAIAFLFVMAALYVGAYWATVQRTVNGFESVVPVYRTRNDFLSNIFAPVHGLDRKVRDRYWSDESWGDAFREMMDRKGIEGR